MKIERIKILGLFKFLDYDIKLNPEINLIHGINGIGKTTILNILTNILNGDLKKFYQLSFKEIEIYFSKNDFFKLYRIQENKASLIFFDFKIGSDFFEKRDIRKTNSVEAFLRRLKLKPLLLPAQRLSLDETYYYDDDESLFYRREYNRRFRGRDIDVFQPNPKMTNVLNVPSEITEMVRRFSLRISQTFSRFDNLLFERYFENMFFQKPFNKLTDLEVKNAIINLEKIKNEKNIYANKYKSIHYRRSRVLDQIEKNIDNINNVSFEIVKFIDLYLENITQKNSFIKSYIEPFKSFEKIINELFKGKKISIKLDAPAKEIFTIVSESNDRIEIKHLSSGEKNLILIFFHYLFQMEKDILFMIDEPELSLHIDWQEHIVNYLTEFSKNNQIFVVTHSPDIIQGYREFVINLDKCRI